MGTRSTIHFSKQGRHLVSIYQQYDGYLEGVGMELAEWLNKKKICNGISVGEDCTDLCNGAGCLTAQFIRDFKKEIGGLYITTETDREDYDYFVNIKDVDPGRKYLANDLITITVESYNQKLFSGKPKELIQFIKEEAKRGETQYET